MAATILIVDDSALMRQTMRESLERANLGLRILEAENGEQALSQIREGHVDVVVSDVVMPKMDGLTMLKHLRREYDVDALPVILVTSESEGENRDVSFVEGVNDYVNRPVTESELVARVRSQLRLRALQQELVRAHERHRKLGTHDELTGLANRRHLVAMCRKELGRARRHRLAMTISLVEIDDFPTLSKKIGPLVSDAVVTELAEVIQEQLRTADVMGRVGSARFGILLPHTDSAQGRRAGERLCETARGRAFPNLETGQLTLSVGCASYPDTQAESVDELFSASESCVRKAIDLGGDCVESWKGR